MRVFLFAQRVAVHGAHLGRASAFHARTDDRLAGHLSARGHYGSSRQGSPKN